MKTTLKVIILFFAPLVIGCIGKEEKEEKFSYEKKSTNVEKVEKKEEKVPASKRVDLTTKGVGPITSLELLSNIDQAMVKKGEGIFRDLCITCHRVGKNFVGPDPTGLLNRRTPEWVMNMILNPEKMVEEDDLAQALLKEYNGSPMINQNVSNEDARAILEYFRTLE